MVTANTGKYMGRVVLFTDSCVVAVGAKSFNGGVTLHQAEELTLTG